ncbi:MAG: V-type ATP synthase subunit F [Angelakisella sp.]|nr:V-type ATP synthase subunit F [Angelakisella sp.]
MRFYLLSDNIDTQMGMRLAGIEGVVLHDAKEVEAHLTKLMDDPTIGVVLMTNKMINLCPQLVYDFKLNRKRPLIVEVTDRHGAGQLSDAITRYVREAVGITI